VEKLAAVAEAVLDAGGEAAPTLTRDPRVPRLGAIAEVGS
jgi:hypothetical protein